MIKQSKRSTLPLNVKNKVSRVDKESTSKADKISAQQKKEENNG